MTNIIEVDALTGDETIIELTEKEIQEREIAYEAQKSKEETEATAKAEAKVALLEKLGITADEAKLLLA